MYKPVTINKTNDKSNTTLYISIAGMVALVAVTIFLVLKKK